MDSVGRASLFIAESGMAGTCVYLWGLLERRDKTVSRMGIDAAIVVLVYLSGTVVLYSIGRTW
jgi:cation:H+ antiporter